jgi:hypothetical protein
MAPLAMPAASVSVPHGSALVDALPLLHEEVGVALQALVLGWPVALLAVFIAQLASAAVDPKSDRALGHALSVSAIVEGQEVEIMSAGIAV